MKYLSALCWLLMASPVAARDVYVAPLNAAPVTDPDGTINQPYPSLADAFRMTEIRGGDRLLMLAGGHGGLFLGGLNFDETVTFQAVPGQQAQVEYILIDDSRNLTLKDLHVVPTEPTGQKALVLTQNDAADIRFEDLTIMSQADAAETYFSWGINDWTGPWRMSGVRFEGPRNSLIDSTIIGVAAAITTLGEAALIQGNHISGYSADALRGLGDNTIFADNIVQDCVKVDGNHDDGFQGWAPRGKNTGGRTALSGLQLRRNHIIEWTGPAEHPLRCRLQGIALFAGPYPDLIVQNNLVVVSAYHGITVNGGENARVIGNTVVLGDVGRSDGYPWIMIGDRKDGTPARGVTVRNNVAMHFSNRTAAINEPLRQSNATIVNLIDAFADPINGNYAPRPDGPLVDMARPQTGWGVDLNGNARPEGLASDLGAIESN